MSPELQTFLLDVVRIDLEVDRENRRVLQLGALRLGPDGQESTLRLAESPPAARIAAELDAFSRGASAVLGHNLLHHDLPVLRSVAPDLHLLNLPVIDTLYLSALCFPEKPYHRLVKDYRLVKKAVNDPVADARLATEVFVDAWQRLAELGDREPDLLRFYSHCFDPACERSDPLADGGGIQRTIRTAGSVDETRQEAPAELFERLVEGSACRYIARQVSDMLRPAAPLAVAYAVAWLRVAGEDSVLPPWIPIRFPVLGELLDRLRRCDAEDPCPDEDACPYCREAGLPERELERYFGFAAFRAEPKTADGESLQRRAALAGLTRRSQLSVLATGAGKSVCYQLPALVHYRRRGRLTLVISPLQALMKDQVENLNRRIGMERAAALNGLLTPPERGRVAERVRNGEIALLYVAPEQLRNRSFFKMIEAREIAGWVFDEAHCLSKWGHDFRPDYLYAASFIRQLATRQQCPVPAVSCYTATAKKDVIEEILQHFRTELQMELELSVSSTERSELRFVVEQVPPQRKLPRIAELIRQRLDLDDDGSGSRKPTGSAVIYFSSRKGTEEAARFLTTQGLDAAAFHAGLTAPIKREVLDDFTAGKLAVVCATNAFGMGIDKDDVRLVVHGDIPGSLEAYLQEAGRAGRDRRSSDCVLLFDEDDVERQFKLAASSKLEKHDLEQVLRAIRRAVRRRPGGTAVLTPGEILRDEELDVAIRPDDWQADTQIRAAVAWLERAGFLTRGHNRTWVFQGKLTVPDLDTAKRRLKALRLAPAEYRRRLSILRSLIEADEGDGLSVDELAQRGPDSPGGPSGKGSDTRRAGNQVVRDLQALVQDGLLSEGLQLTAYLRPKGKNNSRRILDTVARLERKLLEILQEEYPDAEPGSRAHLSLRRLNQRLVDENVESTPSRIQSLLKSLSEDGKGLAEKQGSLDLRFLRRGHYSVHLRRGWSLMGELADRRRQVAQVALDVLIGKVAEQAGGQVLVGFALEDVVRGIKRDLALRQTVKDPLAAAERALLFLHEHRAVQLQNGLAVFRQAMTLELSEKSKGRRYTLTDYRPLAEHYDERTFQTHVMARYAEEAKDKVQRGLDLVRDYFEHGRDVFVAKWFHDADEELKRATAGSSYRLLVDDLGNAEQQAVVTAPLDRNMLILAGPGSGKSRVVVHRAAYLLRVARVPPSSILIVCFNRAASLELRRRLKALVGRDAFGVTVCTYHGLAMRLTGRSFAGATDPEAGQVALNEVIPDAVRLLAAGDDDETREDLLAGYRHILVDEYQDITEDQYRLVAAVAGRRRDAPDRKLSLLAVGDDDQTIYGFNGADLRFIRRFRDDYIEDDARGVFHLVQCYRSSAAIIAASNHLIASVGERMKVEQPIRINDGRRFEPAGEPVRMYQVRSPALQAATVADRIVALREHDADASVAVLGRKHNELTPTEFLLRSRLPSESLLRLGDDGLPPLSRVREIHDLLDWSRARHGHEARLSEAWTRLPENGGNRWQRLLGEQLTAFHDEVVLGDEDPDPAFDPAALTEFLYESLAEYRRRPSAENSTVLATVHAAKGLEFDHVFLLDGDWRPQRSKDGGDDERRLYYVGMTRAKRALHLFTGLHTDPNPHVAIFDRNLPERTAALIERPAAAQEAPPDAIWRRRRERVGLEQVHLSWPARRRDQTTSYIRALPTGAALHFKSEASNLFLCDETGRKVAKLSRKGQEYWARLVPQVESAEVVAWIHRAERDESPEFARGLKETSWEVPIVDVVLRP